MAERRMFAKSIILFGDFLELTANAQLLYLFLNMQADDDGFVGNPKSVLYLVRNGRKCLQELVDRGLVLKLSENVVVITHWLVHNQIRKDRYKPTYYAKELALLTKTPSGAYRLLTQEERCQNDNQTVTPSATQERIGQVSTGKVSLAQDREGQGITGGAVALPPERSSPLTDYEKMILDLYHKYCEGMPECGYLDGGLRQKINSLKALGWSREALEEVFRVAGASPFLKGENKDGWYASLDWLCDDETLRKISGGKYQQFRKKEQQKTIHGCTELGEAELEAIQKLLSEA